AAWASGISPGPANETGQQVSFTTTTDNPALFLPGGLPTVDSRGVLAFTPAMFATGQATVTVTARDDGGTANGGRDATTAKLTITIKPRNQPPVFLAAGDQTALEDAGPQSLQWATAVSPGQNEPDQSVTFSLSSDNPSLFAAQPALSPDGVLTYTPAPDANGTAHVAVVARDNGGTANGGRDTASASFTIDVIAVNDAPSFRGVGDLLVSDNAGPQLTSWLTSQSAGPPDEDGQHISYETTNDNPSLFAVTGQPTLRFDGTLAFAPVAGAHGSATVTVTAHDDGGTANGGQDTTSQTFTLTVQAVNDAPTFTGAGNQTVLEDAGAQTVNWATSISPGPADESGQTVTLTINNTNAALFSTQPAINQSGQITYTPAANANGTSTITVTATDNGGTANGGQDTTSQTFTITVQAVNDAPTFTGAGNQTILEDAGAQTVNWATSISPGPADESGQTVILTINNTNAALFSTQPAINQSGQITYTPAANANGTSTITVTATDNG